ncbi:SAM-dependent methyltransferase [Paucibacter sediminis]|uniref:SAM-dependent methyltransferase n=1 Tax=Paucibacter sediminis TaxID=3019553 RepID=A0AA95NE35_9BURK|nr:SAM-dependent methyltransferase [Paucibacter sp. S2-9]WIT13392.1 SAM-dependent methyltransferase [Paucibacter sp. S2-9]
MPGYQVKQERVHFDGVAALDIRSLLDKQQYADPLGQAEALGISSAHWPLFGLLWPSGLRLAQAMADRPLIAGESILEIGCGLALASLVSHRRGALVTASDCHPLAGAFLLENLLLNQLAPMRYCHGDWSAAPAERQGAQLTPGVQGRFDLIMGSDVLYERDEGGALPLFIERHAAPVSEVLIVDPERGNRSAFSKRMAALGYRLEETLLHRDLPPAQAYRGRLLRYRREQG